MLLQQILPINLTMHFDQLTLQIFSRLEIGLLSLLCLLHISILLPLLLILLVIVERVEMRSFQLGSNVIMVIKKDAHLVVL